MKLKEKELQLIGLFLFIWFDVILLIDDLIKSMTIAFLITIILMQLIKLIPKTIKKKHAKKVEKYLAFALMDAFIELKLKQSFEKVINNLTKANYKELSQEMKKIETEMNAGKSFQKSALSSSNRINSRDYVRALNILSNIYEQGTGEESLKVLAEELLLKQKNLAREFNNKMVFFSLVFIACSAIIPALFQVFTVIGSIVLSLEMKPFTLIIINALVFPLINLGILFYIRIKTPEFLK